MLGKLKERLSELNNIYPVWKKETIWEKFANSAKSFPENIFVIQNHRKSYSYADAEKEIYLLAKGFLEMGIRPGDHVAVQLYNSLEMVLTTLALSMIGAVKIPINIAISSKELTYILTQSDSCFLISGYPEQLVSNEMVNRLKGIIFTKEVCCKDTICGAIQWSNVREKGTCATERLLNSVLSKLIDADDISDIMYTSGTTGSPKGVTLSHDMLMKSAFASCLNRGFEIGRRIYVPLPLFHSYGYIEGLLAVILVGGTIIINDEKFNAEKSLKYMLKYKANDILSVPSQMIGFIKYLKENPISLPDLHSVYCSATSCPVWVWSDIKKYLGVDDLITGYGMTEVCGASMQTQPYDSLEIISTRVGKILPGGCSGLEEFDDCQIQYKVIDSLTGKNCTPEEPGELWCRGEVVTKGYYKNPKANKALFTEDGWFKTGDVGRFDENGYLELSGRVDDIYKINGEKVSPKSLEEVVGNCSTVNIVEIVGIPDEKLGAVGVAFIQLHEDTSENRIITEQYCYDNLAYFQVPKYFYYFSSEDWPRTSSGKIQKYKLQKFAKEKMTLNY